MTKTSSSISHSDAISVLNNSWCCWLDGRTLGEGPVADSAEAICGVRVHASVIVAGICRSDIKELSGSRFGLRTFGHEFVARVDRIEGSDSATFPLKTGERFILDPHVPIQRTSGFASHVVLEGPGDLLAEAMRPVPAEIAADRMVFSEPLACALHCIERALDGTRSLRTAAVIGAGLFGILISVALQRRGLEVTVANRTMARLWKLEQLSIWNLNISRVDQLPADVFDLVIDATAQLDPHMVQLGLRAVTPGGRYHIFAGTAPGDMLAGGVDLDDLRRQERVRQIEHNGKPVRLSGSHGAVTEDFDRAINELSRPDNPLLAEYLISGRVDLRELKGELLRLRDDGWFGRVLVDPVVVTSGPALAAVRSGGGVSLYRIQTPRTGAVVVAPLTVGLCGTDRQILNNSRPDHASVLGHEAVCEVIASDLPTYQKGQLVVVNPVDRDRPEKVVGHSSEGLLQERYSFSEEQLARDMLVPYEGPSVVLGSLTEPLASVLHGLSIADHYLECQSVAIIGDGALGAILLQVALLRGLDAVLFSNKPSRAATLRSRLGLPGDRVVTLSSNVDDSFENCFDAVFHCATRNATSIILKLAYLIVRDEGIVDLLAGIDPTHSRDAALARDLMAVRASNVCGKRPFQSLVFKVKEKNIRFTGHRGTSVAHLSEAMQLLNEHPDLFRPIITHTLSLAEAAVHLDGIARGYADPAYGSRLKTVVRMPRLMERGDD